MEDNYNGKDWNYYNLENKNSEVYHDVIILFKIYRSVSWRMQVQIGQVKHRFQKEYGTDVDEFLESIYQAMGWILIVTRRISVSRVEAIESSNKFLKLIDESVDLMRQYHPQGKSITGFCIILICQPISR